jgi:tripartite-type tricarboxylate transporter receptor subunit TctC
VRIPNLAGVLGLGVLASTAAISGDAFAQYPSEPVTIVVPYGPGGGNDTTARFLAEQLSRNWGQPVVVENRPGAGTALGANYVAKSDPDGYTLLFVSVTFTTMAAVQTELPFDPSSDLQAVAKVGAVPLGMASNRDSSLSSVKQLVDEAGKRQLTYSTAGPGGINQFASELLNQVAGIESEPVHYNSGNEAITALMGGHVDFYFGSLLQMQPFIEDQRVNGLMVTSSEHSESVPNVPTTAEAGVPGAEVELWWGVFAPGETPKEIVDAINQGIRRVQSTPEMQEFMANGGARVTPISPQEFTDFVQNELRKWRGVAEFAGIHLQ